MLGSLIHHRRRLFMLVFPNVPLVFLRCAWLSFLSAFVGFLACLLLLTLLSRHFVFCFIWAVRQGVPPCIFSAERNSVKQFHVLHRVKTMDLHHLLEIAKV
jgi:hypothetical protein